jgi:hypothetical protein
MRSAAELILQAAALFDRGTLKIERLYRHAYRTVDEVATDVF